jgi:hypothetical protein
MIRIVKLPHLAAFLWGNSQEQVQQAEEDHQKDHLGHMYV